MRTRRALPWLLLALAAGMNGCRARLPVPEEGPTGAVAPFLAGQGDPVRPRYRPPIEPDRLLEAVRYNPPSTGVRSVGDFLFTVRICAHDGR